MNKFNIDYAWVDAFWDKIEKKLSVVAPQVETPFPYLINRETGKYNSKLCHWWTNGFWPGMMWLMYLQTGDDKYKAIAENVEKELDTALINFNGLDHDVGFMWLTSAVANYRITGNEESKTRGRHAATILAGRFNPAGNYIRAWNKRADNIDRTGWAIIDCMLNIHLLYWAAEIDDDPRFRYIADTYAHTAMKHFVREDGSTNHIVAFNPETGEVADIPNGQGYAPDSCWSRGNSWALYGFVLSYIHTGNKEYLETSKKVARHFMANVDDSGVPRCDFNQPAQPDYRDTTAGACAACGLIELAKIVPEDEKEFYISSAVKLLKGLESNCDFTLENQSILQNGCVDYHNETFNLPIIYGDYYMMEALLKLKGNEMLFW